MKNIKKVICYDFVIQLEWNTNSDYKFNYSWCIYSSILWLSRKNFSDTENEQYSSVYCGLFHKGMVKYLYLSFFLYLVFYGSMALGKIIEVRTDLMVDPACLPFRSILLTWANSWGQLLYPTNMKCSSR